MRVLFKNGTIVTMNGQRDVIKGDLLTDENKIVALGREINLPADRVIDLKGDVLIPGLIQTHVHLCQTLFRGQADDLELLDWLKYRIWPLEGAHDSESLYDSAQLGIGELFLGGTTTIVDMETVHNTESAFQAILDSGLRAISGKCMMDAPNDDIPKSLRENTTYSLQKSVDLF
ncbi:MAG TPA: amidohydrolase family protein, partial [Candidatus Deferrimicrobium sp.]|nr:amidohydrolase family protein [Candidatus Deferrimicrobium sp.]